MCLRKVIRRQGILPITSKLHEMSINKAAVEKVHTLKLFIILPKVMCWDNYET